jgi:hypothetical protein
LTKSGFLTHNTHEWTALGKVAYNHALQQQKSKRIRKRR